MRNCDALRHRSAERVSGGSSRPHRTLEYRAGRRTDHQARSLLKRQMYGRANSDRLAPAGVACRLITASQGQRGCAQSRRDGGRESLAPSCPQARKHAPGRLALFTAMARWAPLSSLLPVSSKVGESQVFRQTTLADSFSTRKIIVRVPEAIHLGKTKAWSFHRAPCRA
jgi:hypothetical protein